MKDHPFPTRLFKRPFGYLIIRTIFRRRMIIYVVSSILHTDNQGWSTSTWCAWFGGLKCNSI